MINSKCPKMILLCIGLLFNISCAQTHTSDNKVLAETIVLPKYVFTPSESVSNQVEQTLATAKSQHKKAIFVLGAQWCHDSRGLAKNFSTPQMQKILTKHYQVLFVDAGYLEKGFDLVQQFNIPVYYGTPTVMVVDPNSANVLNRASMKKWQSADKVPLNEYLDYFENLAKSNVKDEEQNSTMQAYLTVINNFETEQAIRLKAAYNIIGPLLKQYVESENKEAPAGFNDKWQQVSNFRSSIPDDIQRLIAQAKSNVQAGSSTPLTLPTYPAFTWE